jgi:uncharacterized membrane protein YeaQ/YmgE (transglycosylase-associated protein family)
MFDIIGWIVFGLVAGLLARALMPGKDPGGCIVTVLLGIVGAVVGGFVARLLGVATSTNRLGDRSFFIQLAFAVIGALIILALYRAFAGKRA